MRSEDELTILKDEFERMRDYWDSLKEGSAEARQHTSTASRPLFDHLVKAKLDLLPGDTFDDREQVRVFYEKRSRRTSSKLSTGRTYEDFAEAASKAKIYILAKLLAPYREGPGKQREWWVDLPTDTHRFEPFIRPAGQIRPSKGLDPGRAQKSRLKKFERLFHRYHLTLDKEGRPVWLYTLLTFAWDAARGALSARAPILLDQDDLPDEHMYDWLATECGDHLLLTSSRTDAETDIGVELFLMRREMNDRLFGVRLNDTWQEEPATVADSIVIMAHSPFQDGGAALRPGPISTVLGDKLEQLWKDKTKTTLVRLPTVDVTAPSETVKPVAIHQEPLTRKVWAPYLAEKGAAPRPTLIVYGTPLFTRSLDFDTYTRRVGESDESSAAQGIRDRIADGEPPEEICRPFLRRGDMLCTFRLYEWLRTHGVQVLTPWGCHQETDFDLLFQMAPPGANVVVIGGYQVNGIVREYEGAELYRVEDAIDRSSVSRPRYLPRRHEGDKVVDVASDGTVGGDEWGQRGNRVPVLITRRKGISSGVITVIASNRGRAVERVGQILTDETELAELMSDVRMSALARRSQEWCQILVDVVITDGDGAGGACSIVGVWPE
jgi:hypothetical protein